MSDEQKKSVSESLRDWGIDVDRLGERARESFEQAQTDLSEVRGTLRQALVHAKDAVLALQAGGSPAAAEVKQGFERAWREIERAFAAARTQADSGTGEPPAPEPPPPPPETPDEPQG